MTPEEGLLKHFGFTKFRDGQREAIEALIASKDVLCLFPTGAGKSLCFQLPVLLEKNRFALVVSPLISLMEDQLSALTAKGIACAVLNGSVKTQARSDLLSDLASPQPSYRLVYVTPEQLTQAEVSDALVVAAKNIAYLAVDEAHCISSWGHDFRPAYRKLHLFRKRLGISVPIIACTATATPKVKDDILASLKMANPVIVAKSFDRPNLVYSVRFKTEDKKADLAYLVKCVKKFGTDSCGIIYCFKRVDCDDLSASLSLAGVQAKSYHAGLGDAARLATQKDWVEGKVKILVATIAFGMGIDKANVRFVIHNSMSKNMEGYYQESGRAGRDGKTSRCILFYSEKDFNLLTWLATKSKLPGAQEHLQVMKDLCLKPACRRQSILSHFGEKLIAKPPKCCDFCKDPKKTSLAAENYFYRAPKKEIDYAVESAEFAFEFEGKSTKRKVEEIEDVPALKQGSVKSRIWAKLDKLGS